MVLVNPNIATVQTSEGMADRTYFLPVTLEMVRQVIDKERPDSILLQFGGQTALNCGIELMRAGVLDQYNVRVLGTPVAAIIATEDREIFSQKLIEINEKIAMGFPAVNLNEAKEAAKKIGYPVIIRAAFALGAGNEAELTALCEKAFASSAQVLVEKPMKDALVVIATFVSDEERCDVETKLMKRRYTILGRTVRALPLAALP